MSLEFLFYLILLILGAIIQFKSSINITKKLYIPVVLLFFVIVRFNTFDLDFVVYAQYMHGFSIFMYREVGFYFLLTQIYSLVQHEIFTFIIIDFILFYFIFKATQNISSKAILLIPILMTSFPFIMGLENVYRQYGAVIFFLYSYTVREKSELKSNIFFIISILFHNSLLFFLPILMIKKFFLFNLKQRISMSTFLSVFIVIILYLMFNTDMTNLKSNYSTGLNLVIVYYSLFAFILSFFLIKFKFKILKVIKLFPSIFLASSTLLPFILWTESDTAGERLGMIFISILMVDLFNYSLSIKDTNKAKTFRLLMFLFFSIPTLLFSSARNMLF